jgi:hypothetical protein
MRELAQSRKLSGSLAKPSAFAPRTFASVMAAGLRGREHTLDRSRSQRLEYTIYTFESQIDKITDFPNFSFSFSSVASCSIQPAFRRLTEAELAFLAFDRPATPPTDFTVHGSLSSHVKFQEMR